MSVSALKCAKKGPVLNSHPLGLGDLKFWIQEEENGFQPSYIQKSVAYIYLKHESV